jgi:CelD/BcsL family acetyltransferase involved in cellulose biosynthesis
MQMETTLQNKQNGSDNTGWFLECLHEFDFHSAEYKELFENSDATAFQNPIWLMQFYTSIPAARNATPLIVVGRDSTSHKLKFVIPLVKRSFYGINLIESADLGVTDYASPIVAIDAVEPLARDAELSQNILKLIGSFSVLRIKPVRSEARALWTLFFDAKFGATDFSAHAVKMAAPYNEWRQKTYSKSHLKYIKRRKNKLEQIGEVKLELLEGDEALEGLAYLKTKRTGRFDGDPIQQPHVEEFYQQVAFFGATTGYTKIYRLSCNDQTVGTVFCTVSNTRLNYLLIGCDYKTFGKYSPGIIMYDMIMQHWCDNGGEIMDFTIGDEPFKFSFGTEPTQMYQMLKTKGMIGFLVKLALRYKYSY